MESHSDHGGGANSDGSMTMPLYAGGCCAHTRLRTCTDVASKNVNVGAGAGVKTGP